MLFGSRMGNFQWMCNEQLCTLYNPITLQTRPNVHPHCISDQQIVRWLPARPGLLCIFLLLGEPGLLWRHHHCRGRSRVDRLHFGAEIYIWGQVWHREAQLCCNAERVGQHRTGARGWDVAVQTVARAGQVEGLGLLAVWVRSRTGVALSSLRMKITKLRNL